MPLVTLKNKVEPLTWNVPIANKDGTPTPEFQVKWAKQLTANASIPDLTTAAKVSGVLDLIGAAKGAMLYRAALQWNTLSGAAGHDGWVMTWNDATGLPEWRSVVSGGGASSFYLDGTDGYVALVDSDGILVLDSLGRGIYSKDPVLPAAMLPAPTAGTRGGVKSLAAVAHKFLTSIDTAGLPAAAQPAAADISDYVKNGTWTPTDTSGAGLSLTVTKATYSQIGNMVTATVFLTYPATVNGLSASIGGLPGTADNYSVAMLNNTTANFYLVRVQSGTSTVIFLKAGNVLVLNSELSGASIIFTVTYLTT